MFIKNIGSEFGRVLSYAIVGKNCKSVRINFSSNVLWNSAVNPWGPELLSDGRFWLLLQSH